MMPTKPHSNTAPRSSKVSFGKRHVKKIPHLNDITDEEQNNIWWSEEDAEEMRQRACDVAFGMIIEGESTRGLEKFVGKGAELRRERRSRLVQGVLQAQRETMQDQPIDILLANLSAKLSVDCQDLANQRAYKDALETKDEDVKRLEAEVSSQHSTDSQNHHKATLECKDKLECPTSSKTTFAKKIHTAKLVLAELSFGGRMQW